MKKILLILLFTGFAIAANAQHGQRGFLQESMSYNRTGMYVLGGWAMANMAVGGFGWSRGQGSARYFHQMNFFWNTVNLGIAGISMYTAAKMQPYRMSPQEMMDTHILYENLFLINGGLDILYVGTGFLLRHISTKRPARADQLLGYGNSVILQGGFLFLFDGVMYFIQRAHRIDFLEDFKLGMISNGMGLSMQYTF